MAITTLILTRIPSTANDAHFLGLLKVEITLPLLMHHLARLSVWISFAPGSVVHQGRTMGRFHLQTRPIKEDKDP